jgi:hypothetical protein
MALPMTEQEVLVDIRERLVRVETKLDTQNDLSKKVDNLEGLTKDTESRSKSNTHRLDKLEANNQWLWRTVAGAIIAAVIAIVMKGG